MSGTTDDARPLRIDAERNRARIVAAAQAAFAEHGLDASLEDVAEEAGVGIATLYRRFPSRGELISACFGNRLEEYVRAADAALEDPDAWRGFCGFLERICEMQAADRGLADVLTRSLPMARNLDADRTRGYESSVKLIAKAQAQGSLRPDFVPEDLVLVLMANAGVVQAAGHSAPDAWRRSLGFLLDGLRAAGATHLAPSPDPRQVMRAMRRLEHPRQSPIDD